MFKNLGQYAKTVAALLTAVAALVPQFTQNYGHDLKLAIPAILTVFGVYAVPNAAAAVKAPEFDPGASPAAPPVPLAPDAPTAPQPAVQ